MSPITVTVWLLSLAGLHRAHKCQHLGLQKKGGQVLKASLASLSLRVPTTAPPARTSPGSAMAANAHYHGARADGMFIPSVQSDALQLLSQAPCAHVSTELGAAVQAEAGTSPLPKLKEFVPVPRQSEGHKTSECGWLCTTQGSMAALGQASALLALRCQRRGCGYKRKTR